MRTDINRVDSISKEMKLNDKLYEQMKNELDDLILDYYFSDYEYGENEEVIYGFETLYFFRRILSVISNRDLPFKAALGLYFFRDRLKIINNFREYYLPDEDSDSEMLEFVLELGYRFYDLIYIPGMTEDEMLDLVEECREYRKEASKCVGNS
jgi:hypothetical protein